MKQETRELIEEMRDQHRKHANNADNEREKRFHEHSASALHMVIVRASDELEGEE